MLALFLAFFKRGEENAPPQRGAKGAWALLYPNGYFIAKRFAALAFKV